mgnify:CR=1 FL=1
MHNDFSIAKCVFHTSTKDGTLIQPLSNSGKYNITIQKEKHELEYESTRDNTQCEPNAKTVIFKHHDDMHIITNIDE